MTWVAPPLRVTVNTPSSPVPKLVKSRLAVPDAVVVVGFGGGMVRLGILLVCSKSAGRVLVLDAHLG
jgi:hypothetical protein